MKRILILSLVSAGLVLPCEPIFAFSVVDQPESYEIPYYYQHRTVHYRHRDYDRGYRYQYARDYNDDDGYQGYQGGYRSGFGFPAHREATGRKVFIYNPNTLGWGVYDAGGNLVRTGHGSGGKGYCPDVGRRCRTPVGVFHVAGKAGPDYISRKFPVPYGGAPMPYAMFFHGGYAIHGSYDVPNYNASHGCIRVIPEDARWLNYQFLNSGSTVIVMPYRSYS